MIQEPFTSTAMQDAYRRNNKEERRRLFKIVFWFAFFGMPAGISLDMQVYPEFVPYFFKLRLLSSLLVTLLLWVYYRPWAARFDRALFIILLMIPQAIIAWMIFASEGPLSPYYAGLNIVLMAFCLLLPWTYQETLVFSVLTLILYFVACLVHGGVRFGGIFFNNTYFIFMTATFAVIGSYFTNRLRVREFVTRYELDRNRRELEESNQKLTELDRAKTRFFANISHELRTPLTLLISPLEMLRTRKAHLLDEESRGILELMHGNAMRLLKLINDLLDLVKMESGRMTLHREPVDLEGFTKGLARSVEAAARDKRVELGVRTDPGIGSFLLDRDKVEKILLNLLFNGIKFTPAGGRVELRTSSDPGGVVLSVSDTGMGIPEDQQKFLFQRFWQADDSSQRKYQGTGLGLALVKELAEAHGGTVSAESRLGKGSTFTVSLPAERAPEGAGRTPQEGAPRNKEGGKAPTEEWLASLYRRAELFPAMTSLSDTLRPEGAGGGGRVKILVADDEPDMLRFLRSQMERDFEVLEAVDGNQAVQKAKQFLPDLILMDMMMPEKDGIEACREIRAHVPTQGIPIVMLTARADEGTKFSALGSGVSDFLAKPFSGTELHVRVRNLIESHQYQKDLARQKNALESTLEQVKETEGQLVQSEKVASLGRLSAGIIHEVNNPLNYALSALHVLKVKTDLLPPEERGRYGEVLGDIEEGVGRVARIVSDLRAFTHPKASAVKDMVLLEEVVATTLRFFGHEFKDKLTLRQDLQKGLKVWGNRNDLIHVLVNLIQNALDALKAEDHRGGGELFLEGKARDGKVFLKVRDNGEGIEAAHLDKIFDPFFTTKDVGQGMGLGLSICWRIVKEQGGNLTVKSEKGRFTEFTLELPAPEG